MSFGNPKRDFMRGFERLRGRKYGRVVRGPYAQIIGTSVDTPSPGNPTTGQTWVADVLMVGVDRVVKGVPLSGINHRALYANVEQIVALETIQGRLTVTGRAEFDMDQGNTFRYDDNGNRTATLGLGTTCRFFTLGELGSIPDGGFGTTSLQPTLCTDVAGNQEILG